MRYASGASGIGDPPVGSRVSASLVRRRFLQVERSEADALAGLQLRIAGPFQRSNSLKTLGAFSIGLVAREGSARRFGVEAAQLIAHPLSMVGLNTRRGETDV